MSRTPEPPLEARWLEELARYDTPTILNTIELFGVRPRTEGYTDGRIRALFPRLGRVVGYVTTAVFESASEPEEGDAYASLADQIETFLREVPEPRVVVFEDADLEPKGATFGEVMCTAYKAFGCKGLITSGGGRDLEQVEALGFPCWVGSVIPSHAYCRIREVHVPVTVGGAVFRPGDLVHADANGVALIPLEIAREVAAGARLLVEAEEVALGAARTPRVTLEAFRSAHARARELFRTIPERAREIAAREG